MAAYQWVADTPPGVLKNRALSTKLRYQAIAETEFMAFVRPEPGYGRKKGESVTIPRIKALPEPVNPRIIETQKIPIDKISQDKAEIRVTEWGRGVEYTNLAEELTFWDMRSVSQRQLKEQMKLSLDTGAAQAAKACKIKYIPTGATSGVFDTDGVASTTATVNLNMYHVAQIRDYLAATLYAPKINGSWVCLANTQALRGIKSDPEWQEWVKYTEPQKKYNSEVGRIEQIRFIEVTHSNALSGAKGTGGVLGEALFIGEDALASAIVLDPELRIGLASDFGRELSCAWYGILEFGEVWPTANAGEARIVHVTSA